ncbi:MAG: GNAT family N-acetyltransferase [Chitinophagaceae bacterium]|nr:GNAT family N-acetyltransferase [Anaerolineae bacterium]
MASSPGFVIRDGLESDIPACLTLESSYETEYVWQVSFQQEPGLRRVLFKTEHLPRIMTVPYPISERSLYLSLGSDVCFLIAAERDEPENLFGYLTMRHDPTHQIGTIQDIVVSQPFRRRRIGTRLLKVARQWALENDMTQLMIETQTKNNPAITFAQNAGFAFCGFNDRYFANQDIAVFFAQALR